MSYRRALLTRWSRRDRLTVLVVAVAVAFLTGTTLVVLAVGSSTAGIAAEYGATGAVIEHQSLADARTAVDGTGEGAVLPLATVETGNGTATVIGVPGGAAVSTVRRGSDGTTLGSLDAERTVRLRGSDGSRTVKVRPRGDSPFPPDWYVTNATTVRTLGVDGALTVTPSSRVPASGVPLQGALGFFVAGTREALAALGIAAVVGTVLVGVTVYNVVRMTVRDRARELFVLRATGTTRWQLRRLFLERTTLLLGAGVAAGYGVGIVATNAAVTLAVTVGLPTSLAVRVSPRAVEFLVPTYAGVLATGWLATLAAVQPTVAKPPVRITDTTMRFSLGTLRPRIASSRAVLPTGATLAAFVVFLLVVAGLGGAAGPLAAADGATITEPGSSHPVNSQVPEAYAATLRDRGIAASPEILLFAVRDGQPFLARGAEYDAFARVADARLDRGRTPRAADEAVVGVDLAETLDVAVGDRILVGGSVRPGVARVRIVGAFAGPGPTDDQLIVSLPTARHLSTVGDDRVNFIRAERLPDDAGAESTAGVTHLSAPAVVPAGAAFAVGVTVRNDGLRARTVERTVRFDGAERRLAIRVPANAERSANVTFEAGSAGSYRLDAGERARQLRVAPPDAVRLRGVPGGAPPDSQPRVRVVDARGAPATNATVTVGDRALRVDGEGAVRLPLEDPGEYRVTASRGTHTDAATVVVSGDAERSLEASVRVSPATPSPVVGPTAAVRLSNPWNRTIESRIGVRGPGATVERTIRLDPAATATVETELARQPPGSYEVVVERGGASDGPGDGEPIARATYRVSGDDRIAAALATGGRTGTTGIGQAAEVAFGNLRIALALLVLLGGAMAVGGAGATFAGAVHANATVLGLLRAVGYTRQTAARLIVGDALRLGVVAVVAAVVVGLAALAGLEAIGLLTAYGVSIAARPSSGLLVMTAVGALAVVVAGAVVAVVSVLSATPAELLRGGDRR
jgi:hypothetical protein